MNKININDNYIKTIIKEIDYKLSIIQIAILIITTILISTIVILNSYMDILSTIFIAFSISILLIIYVIIELKRNILIEKYIIKEIKVNLPIKEDKVKEKYLIHLDGCKSSSKVPYEEYRDLNPNSIGYAVINEKRNKALLWFDKDKYEYTNKNK